MIRRTIEPVLRRAAAHFPAVLVTGPRQSGKTTLCRSTFPDHPYVSLEAPDVRSQARDDPRGFLKRFVDGAIFDEVQRVPELLSYLQGIIDEDTHRAGRFILTGSHNLLLMESVSQSLAGRVALLTLLPLSLEELATAGRADRDLGSVLLTGGYPRLHDSEVPLEQWLGSYFATYIERDVREVLAIEQLSAFDTFVHLCAGRSAQLVNLAALGAEAGVSQPTARAWLSALRASYFVWPLSPWHSNLTSRLVKTQRLHLLDTGLLCWLLGIRSAEQITTHPLRGAIFETFVFSELLKARLNRGLPPDLFFLRDSKGREIDLVIADASHAHAIEVKATQTAFGAPLDALGALDDLLRGDYERKVAHSLVYGGDESVPRSSGTIRSWRELANPIWATPTAGG